MRKQLLIGSLMIAGAALIVWAGTARSQENKGPPPRGFYGLIYQPMVGCDTEQEIKDIAAQGDGVKLNAKLEAMHSLINAKGEPTCVYGRYPHPLAVGEVEQVSDVTIEGKKMHAWSMHVGTEGGDWWVLYLAPAEVGDPT